MPTVTIDSRNTNAKPELKQLPGFVYCPMCTHTVPGIVLASRRGGQTVPGQKCPRCSSSLDAAQVMRVDRAA